MTMSGTGCFVVWCNQKPGREVDHDHWHTHEHTALLANVGSTCGHGRWMRDEAKSIWQKAKA